MMGTKERVFSPLPKDTSLEDLVPEDNFYRRLQVALDLSFVRDLVRPFYARGGRPSVDPVVFFKLQLVLFFEGLRSERELMRVAADRLSVRWYLGYDLFEALPDHSNLTRARERFGLSVLRRFFEWIVEECVEAGLVRGEELFFDSTKVEGNAAVDSLAPRWAVEAHLGGLFEEGQEGEHGPAEGRRTGPLALGRGRRPPREERVRAGPDLARRSPGPLLRGGSRAREDLRHPGEQDRSGRNADGLGRFGQEARLPGALRRRRRRQGEDRPQRSRRPCRGQRKPPPMLDLLWRT